MALLLEYLFDLLLVAISVWTILVIRGIGGVVGRAALFLSIASVIFGVEHLLETISLDILHVDATIVGISHRISVLVGSLFLIAGFRKFASIKEMIR